MTGLRHWPRMTLSPFLYNYFSFRECRSRCRFQPFIRLRRHPLRGVDSVRLQILLMGTCRHGLSLVTITGRSLDETPFMQVSTTWALICPEAVHQRPCMTREIETWLSDSRIGNNSVVEHKRQRPVLSPFLYRLNKNVKLRR